MMAILLPYRSDMKRIWPFTFVLLACAALLGHMAKSSFKRSPEITTAPVRVVDADTHEPLSGVTFKVLCAGGTPLANATFTSDARGIAQVGYFASSPIVAVNLSKPGYAPAYLALPKSSHQVSMKKL
jgi:hypothetical protein